jgi:hypothetical protein
MSSRFASDFYVLGGTLIPVFLLAMLIPQARYAVLPHLQKEARWKRFLPSRLVYAFYVSASTIGCALCAWGEFACLQSLEEGRASAGGATPAWAALGFTGGLILIREVVRSLTAPGR